MKRSESAEIVKEVRDRAQESYDFDRSNREEAATDLAFLRGEQWPDKIKRQRIEEDRICLTVNRLPQFVRQITNDIRQADLSIKVIPEDDETDPALAEVFDSIIRQVQYRSSASHVFALTAEHQASCGIGWFRIVTEYADDSAFDQEILIKPIRNPLSVYCDPAAVEPDRSDAMWMILTEMIPKETFKATYPEASEESVDIPDGMQAPFWWSDGDTVRIAEYWRKVPVERTLALFGTGETVDITDMGPNVVQIMGQPVRTRKVKTHKVEQWIVSGSQVLQGPNPWAGKYIPIVPAVGAEIPGDKGAYRYGVIRFAREPMMIYNFMTTAEAEAIALAPKAPWLVTPKMVGPYKQIWDTANKTNRPYLPYEPDPNAPGMRPDRIAPPMPSAALNAAKASAAEELHATTGIYPAAMGAKSNETSGVAIGRRQQEADTSNFHFADNLQRSIEHCGRILVDLIPKVYDNERIIRLHGEKQGDAYVPINKVVMAEDGMPIIINDLSAGSFDVRVSIGRSVATRRLEAAEGMQAFMQAYPNAAPLIGDLFAESMEWPKADEIAERLRRAMPPEILGQDAPPESMPPPDPMAEQQNQLAMAGMQAQTEQQVAKAREANARADKAEVDVRIGMRELMQPLRDPNEQAAPRNARK